MKFLPSPTGYFRFTMEAFKFVGQPFVFIHCHMVICNASDTRSKCARGCGKKDRGKREVHLEGGYPLVQGPIAVDQEADGEKKDIAKDLEQRRTGSELNP